VLEQPFAVDTDLWRSYCAEVHDSLNDLCHVIKTDKNAGGFKQSRDTMALLKPFIHERQHPVTLLFDIVSGLKREMELASNPVKKAMLFRDMWMVRVEMSNPMRIGNIAGMRFIEGKEGREDEQVNLYCLPDRSWHLKYEVYELKNGVQRGRYDLPLNPSIWTDTEEYIYVHRPLLAGSDECDYVLRPEPSYIATLLPGERSEASINPMSAGTLSRKFREYSQCFIPGCSGFGAHGCRHIVATEWIKNHPGAYAIAAVMLHDSEQVVKETYDWCEPKDKAIFWQDYLTKIMTQETAGGGR
jgi:integrase